MYQDFLASLPRKFIEIIVGAFRDEGKRWIENLPETLCRLESDWQIEIKRPFPNLSYHFVAACICADGREAVIKAGFPGEAETFSGEVRTLKFIDGKGLNKLLRFDENRYAMLMEKLAPGENLKTAFRNVPAQAVETAIETMPKFWQKPPPEHDFPVLEKWFDGLGRAEKINFAPGYVRKAQAYFSELNSFSETKVLLHGDFHHENILSAAREPFLAIDPKGIIGNIGYDVSIFLINHANWLKPGPDLRKQLDHAVGRFAEAFEIAPRDLKRWAFAQSVLSAWWTFEENSDKWAKELTFAEIWEI